MDKWINRRGEWSMLYILNHQSRALLLHFTHTSFLLFFFLHVCYLDLHILAVFCCHGRQENLFNRFLILLTFNICMQHLEFKQ